MWYSPIVFVAACALFYLLFVQLGKKIQEVANNEETNWFVPIPRPGTFAFLARDSVIREVLENVRDWDLDKQTKRFVPAGTGLKQVDGFLARELGVVWSGPFGNLNSYDWEWTEFDPGTTEVKRRTKKVKVFFTQFQYALTFPNIELQGNLKATMKVGVTILVLDPVRFVTANKDTPTMIMNLATGAFRPHFGGLKFDVVKSIPPITLNEPTLPQGANEDQRSQYLTQLGVWNSMKTLNGLEFDSTCAPRYETEVFDALFNRVGATVVRVDIVDVEATGEVADALQAEILADLKGAGRVAAAKRDAEVDEQAGIGIANKIDRITAALANQIDKTMVVPTGGPGPHIADILIADKVRESNVTTWIQNKGSAGTGTNISVEAKDKKD